MSILLRSNLIDIKRNPASGSWGITHVQELYPWVRSAPICLTWHDSKDRFLWIADHEPVTISTVKNISTKFGSFNQVALTWEANDKRLSAKVEFLLSSHQPIVMWRLETTNNSGRPIFLDRVTLLHTGGIGPKNIVTAGLFPGLFSSQKLASGIDGLGFNRQNSELAFYSNGWQSWNFAGTLSIDDRFPRTRLGPFALPMRVNAGTPKPRRRGHCVSDMFAVLGDRVHEVGLLVGFTSQRQTFGTIEGWLSRTNPSLRAWAHLDGVRLDPGDSFFTDWAYLQFLNLEEREPLSDYFDVVAQSNQARVSCRPHTGWCSWYYAFEDVSQAFMMENIEWASSQRNRVPIQLIQLDDGYEVDVGDWFTLKDSFPDGLQDISSKIRGAGFMPGIWLAPFLAKRGSILAQRRREWILRDRMGFPANPGFLWDSFPLVLDVSNPEVIDHIQSVVKRMVQEMGFDYLKLDFLYAGALPGKRYNPCLTRAQALYQALQAVRDSAGDSTELLGCGCPLGSGIGIFDAMRIGPDVAPHWKPAYRGIGTFLDKEKGLPSAHNAILTTINRLPMHQRWWTNDPDCLIIRSTETKLTQAEVQTLVSVIVMSAGALILSDHLPALSEERVDWLARLIPPLPHTARAVDWFDTSHPSKLIMDLESLLGTWYLICLINWADQPQQLTLNLNDFGLNSSKEYHVVDFWEENHHKIASSKLQFAQVPPHGVCLFSLRTKSAEPQWLGDTLHISQGLIVKDWQLRSDHLVARLDQQRKVRGRAWIGLTNTPNEFQLEDRVIAGEEIANAVYRLELEFEGEAHLKVSW